MVGYIFLSGHPTWMIFFPPTPETSSHPAPFIKAASILFVRHKCHGFICFSSRFPLPRSYYGRRGIAAHRFIKLFGRKDLLVMLKTLKHFGFLQNTTHKNSATDVKTFFQILHRNSDNLKCLFDPTFILSWAPSSQ